MLYRSFHRLVFPIVIITVIGTVWVVAWSQALVAETERHFWPALPVSHHALQPPSSDQGSLQQVLLKHDEVVGVR